MATNRQYPTNRTPGSDAVSTISGDVADMDAFGAWLHGITQDVDVSVAPFDIDNATGTVKITVSLELSSGAVVDKILDDDTMAADDDTALATQQSIKAYVDAATGGTSATEMLLRYLPPDSQSIASSSSTYYSLGLFDGIDTSPGVGWARSDPGVVPGYIRVPAGIYVVSAGANFQGSALGSSRIARIKGISGTWSTYTTAHMPFSSGAATSVAITSHDRVPSGTRDYGIEVLQDSGALLLAGGWISVMRIGDV